MGRCTSKGEVMEDVYKEVYFDKYCKTCMHEKTNEQDDPCYECLHHPTNVYSHKPIKWEEKTKK